MANPVFLNLIKIVILSTCIEQLLRIVEVTSNYATLNIVSATTNIFFLFFFSFHTFFLYIYPVQKIISRNDCERYCLYMYVARRYNMRAAVGLGVFRSYFENERFD